ncbi:MAG: 1-acyl-sn-glycerol-3-phosphate acyltransferase [Deltaproteobacteria bacterium]|nr:1-acyl-sn-glycerol-3-phosphate acyltransferase [Deltaproteobacteria bacterium]
MDRGDSRFVDALRWAGVGGSTALWGTLSLGSSLFDRTGAYQHFCMVEWSRECLRVAGVTAKVSGLEHVLRDRPQIIFSNHSSFADICVLAAHLPVQFRWLAKRELFKVPFIGWHLARSGHLMIDRGDRESATRLLARAAAKVRSGVNVLVFPEGTRSLDGSLQPFKKGVFHLAIDAGVPLLPIRLLGAHRILPRGTRRLVPGEVEMRVGPPLDASGLTRDDLGALMERVRSAMIELGRGAGEGQAEGEWTASGTEAGAGGNGHDRGVPAASASA